jgi:hypothetical protein
MRWSGSRFRSIRIEQRTPNAKVGSWTLPRATKIHNKHNGFVHAAKKAKTGPGVLGILWGYLAGLSTWSSDLYESVYGSAQIGIVLHGFACERPGIG